MSGPRGFIDSGLVNDNETQLVFLEGDMRHCDADEVRRSAICEFAIPLSIKVLRITLCTKRPFPYLYFHSSDFLDASMIGIFVLGQPYAGVNPASGDFPANSGQSSVAVVTVTPVFCDDDVSSSSRGDLDVPLSSLVVDPSKPAPRSKVDIAAPAGEGAVPSRVICEVLSCHLTVLCLKSFLRLMQMTQVPAARKKGAYSTECNAMGDESLSEVGFVVAASVETDVTERLPHIGKIFDLASDNSAQKQGSLRYSLCT